MSDEEIIKTFLNIGALKFGNFVIKSGGTSPIYIDLRSIISYPEVLKTIGKKIWDIKKDTNLNVDIICGVPYTALPIATAISIVENIPMVMKRKESKSYGTKKMLEGIFEAGSRCLIVEDIVTSGSSVLETAETLRKEGLIVNDCIVVMDRQQGAEKNLKKADIKLHSLFQIQTVLDILCNFNLCLMSDIENARKYFKQYNYVGIKLNAECKDTSAITDNVESSLNPVLLKLRKIIKQKETNLCVAADVETSSELLKLVDTIGPEICILKTHIDILTDFDEKLPQTLYDKAKQYNFLIMEDRKFADIGNTVIHQYRSGIYRIQDWADIVTVHGIPGEGIIDALKSSAVGEKACVLVAQMSSQGNLTTKHYTEEIVKIAKNHEDFVIGFISQSKISSDNFIYMCPGINCSNEGDNLGQQYRNPQAAIQEDGIDIIIVGRGITKAPDITAAVKMYREEAFKAYSKFKNL